MAELEIKKRSRLTPELYGGEVKVRSDTKVAQTLGGTERP